ncbi:uncharacterized protein UV8b_07409 [Ustilaginoidea virens]|uniref:C-CAP/cofactor C-like domain-containing protein n=1 Tax=Ustilaginoidea virens TaxID=1159556 RepID=A0A8E5HXL2_USTVR|nr:uncharacterized protein UV8b_07409 [Ustilaginoidea virens]QUC23168.1 hypothetical protein UV8b_07409 [Ustilaginoidea virens]
MDSKQKFYHHFQDSAAEIQDLTDQLDCVSPVAGERQEAIDHILASISKLQHEVSDASEFTPSYDRKQYSDTIKNLQEKLNETIARMTPKSRFQFRRCSVQEHVDMGAPENDPRLYPGSHSRNIQSHNGDFNREATERDSRVRQLPPTENPEYDNELPKPSAQSFLQPGFSATKNVGISNQSDLHIILPSSAARATTSGSLTDIKCCIVDMSLPTVEGRPWPGLTLRNISHSLVIAGLVDGPVHITGVSNSIIVVIARQVRIHECADVDLYLHCTSHPIIEDCTSMRFAPLPKSYAIKDVSGKENQWDKVDDFKWLKAGQSPNWRALSDAETLDDTVWTKVVPGQPGKSVEETLKEVGVSRQ